jgi:Fur family transcriptional regulator, ferric uptake regulator
MSNLWEVALADKDLRQAGLKVTLPRTHILKILEKADPHHLTAEDVYQTLVEQGMDVSLATVYRVLTQFESAGLVKRHFFAAGHAVFELEHGAHHDHLVCVNCNAVAEFVDDIIEKRQAEIAKKNNFQMTEHNLTIYGLCQRCVQLKLP